MPRKRLIPIVVLVVAVSAAVFSVIRARTADLVLTGIVTTNDVIVSAQVTGQLSKVLVAEGDSVVVGQLIATLAPGELQADQAYYEHSAAGIANQVQESEAALRYQERVAAEQISQAQSTLAAATAQQMEAASNAQNAQREATRSEALLATGAISMQEADKTRNANDVAKARLEAAQKQVEAQRSALMVAQANAEQVAQRQSAVGATKQAGAAAAAQATKAGVRLSYGELRAPIAGRVDVRAAREGEVITAGQPVVTLINPDDLWVRADVEETYIAGIKNGDTLQVRLPSGETRPGVVFYRGEDAGFATRRDVSRTKRDIKTFEVRLRVDNRDRALAVGMTASVILPASVRS